jgi:CBS domain-containing protein
MATVQSILETKGCNVTTIDADATVAAAVDRMTERKIGALVVTRADKPVGIFTERDVLHRTLSPRLPIDKVKVGDVMTATVACCRPETPLSECQSVMLEKGIRHLPVVDGGRLCGLVSSRDMIAAEVVAKQDTIRVLESTIDELNEYLYART